MTEVAEKLIREALKLAPIERATLIEELRSSLDKSGSRFRREVGSGSRGSTRCVPCRGNRNHTD